MVSREQAIWVPFWYELDQCIAVGVVDDFDFFHEPPERLAGEMLPVFFHGNWNDTHLYYRVRKRILSIRHHQLGEIRSIDTNGLDYTFVLGDGRVQMVEAEQSPGTVCGFPTPVTDWRIRVEMEPG